LFASEYLSLKAAQIGVQDLSAHGVGTHLLLDTLTAAGVRATLKPAKELFPSDHVAGCCLLVDTEG